MNFSTQNCPNLFDPALFPDMDKAVDRIFDAIQEKRTDPDLWRQ